MQTSHKDDALRLNFYCTDPDSVPGEDCATFYRTDRGTWVVQGDRIVWVPRRLTSALALPGNDFWLFDDDAVVFAVFSGSGEVVERQLHGTGCGEAVPRRL